MNSEATPLRKPGAVGARVGAGGPECRAAPSQPASSEKAPHRVRPDRAAPGRDRQAQAKAIRYPEAEASRAPRRPLARPLAARAASQAEPPGLRRVPRAEAHAEQAKNDHPAQGRARGLTP